MSTLQIELRYEYISKFVKLTWGDILYGINNNIFSDEVAIKHAVAEIEKNEKQPNEVIELAYLFQGESIHPYIGKLGNNNLDEESSKEKLLFILLKWLFENKELIPEPFKAVAEIYADFDYPEEISKFVYYMPLQDGESGGNAYLLNQWEKYLVAKNRYFSNI
ncbi:DUF2247 family protein [Bacillus sp. FJAT-22090]|uniref:DUF2247 family protein n=1 Tax=Bacillus sp. FJAT-22090 TaxID=1581038 RepID=UPI0011AB1A65|nr:DUF2247 family protein [Bacillus sp. FJAT-22090]